MIDFVLDKINTETKGETLGVYANDEETGETSVCFGVVDCTEDKLFFTLDVRYPNNADNEKITDTIKSAAKEYGLTAEVEQTGKLLYVSKESELVQKLMGVYREYTGSEEEPIAIGGGTYAKAFENMVAFGPIFPGDDDVIHQPNEYGDIEKLMKSFQIVATAMYELAQK